MGTALIAGTILILLAVWPEYFRRFAEAVRNSLDEVRGRQGYRYPPIRTPRVWLAGLGVAMIVLAVVRASSA